MLTFGVLDFMRGHFAWHSEADRTFRIGRKARVWTAPEHRTLARFRALAVEKPSLAGRQYTIGRVKYVL